MELENSLVELENSLVELENSLVELENSLVESENSLVELENSLVELENSLVELESTALLRTSSISWISVLRRNSSSSRRDLNFLSYFDSTSKHGQKVLSKKG